MNGKTVNFFETEFPRTVKRLKQNGFRLEQHGKIILLRKDEK